MTREEIRAKFIDIRTRAIAKKKSRKTAETIARQLIGKRLEEEGMLAHDAVYEIHKATYGITLGTEKNG